MLIFFPGTIISFLLGRWLGKVVAWRRNNWLSGAAALSAVALYTTFPPWLTFLAAYFLARRLGIFREIPRRVFGLSNFLSPEVWRGFLLSPQTVMWGMVYTAAGMLAGLFMVNHFAQRFWRRRLHPLLGIPLYAAGLLASWFALGFGPQALDILAFAGLLIITYVLLSFGDTMLIMRTSMSDTLNEDYTRTAQAKGLPSHLVRDKHAARNALLPVLSRFVINLPYLLAGLVIIEEALHWPGISSSLFEAMYDQDMPLIMGTLLITGGFTLTTRLILDVLYAYLDPRIRYGSSVRMTRT